MKKLIALAVLVLLVLLNACKQNPIADTNYTLKSKADSTSYAIGVTMASNVVDATEDINIDILVAALREKLAEKDLKIDPAKCQELATEFRNEYSGKIAAKNLERGQKFLEENAGKEGIKVTESGLQYQVMREGTSDEKPNATDKVTVHYKGTTIDGVQFDSSYDRGQPVTFPLNQVIRGWTEGVQLMTIGSKFKFFIPANLAYGPRGAGDVIKPNSALIFEVELQKIEK